MLTDDMLTAIDKSSVLLKYFGFTTFRPMQEAVIDNVLAGEDSFVLMPTGGGKSLCYQLPALLLDGVTIVISPLIALMKDQVDSLGASGVPATFLNSSISSEESSTRLKGLFRGKYKLLYLAPERLMMDGFLEIVQKLNVSLIAVDEAHCISEWGHDFRPEYRRLRELRAHFPQIPVIALTATATEQVQVDIARQLGMDTGKLFKASFVRKNLFYEVRDKQETYTQIKKFVKDREGESGIIYCGSRKGCDTLAEKLERDGYPALAYHAGLTAKERSERQERFIRDDVPIMVATIAFGMGIDKPNVRYVIHYDLPKNLEGYYQETGRAGRDGIDSRCVLFYSYGDKLRIDHFIDDKSEEQQQLARRQLMRVISYAESTGCRHRQLAEYFGESFPDEGCGMCDNCTSPVEQFDATIMAQKFLSAVKRTGERFGAAYVVDVLTGSENARVLQNRHSNLPVFGIGSDISRKEWMQLARQLLSMGYLVQGEYNVLKLTAKSIGILFNDEKIFLKKTPKVEKAPRSARRSHTPVVSTGRMDEDLFNRLRRLRKRLADGQNLPPYIIFSDASLREMASEKPGTLSAFAQISGVGEKKLDAYGELFISEILGHLAGE
jgi:ATP-dependent DNA helicase RecQ